MANRELGEFKPWAFLVSVIVFACLGWLLYSRFTFEVQPTKRGSDVQVQMDALTKRVGVLEAGQAAILENMKKLEKEIHNKLNPSAPPRKPIEKQQKNKR